MSVKRTLVIIDMQQNFEASKNPRTIAACRREIKKSIKRGDGILFVEYSGAGKTLTSLTELTQNYPRAFFIKKHEDDGSKEVQYALNKHGLALGYLLICGVNFNVCVKSTVRGLAKKLLKSKITIVADAVNGPSYYSADDILQAIQKFPVKISYVENLKNRDKVAWFTPWVDHPLTEEEEKDGRDNP